MAILGDGPDRHGRRRHGRLSAVGVDRAADRRDGLVCVACLCPVGDDGEQLRATVTQFGEREVGDLAHLVRGTRER
jgi:hypothetical protein